MVVGASVPPLLAVVQSGLLAVFSHHTNPFPLPHALGAHYPLESPAASGFCRPVAARHTTIRLCASACHSAQHLTFSAPRTTSRYRPRLRQPAFTHSALEPLC